MSFIKWWETTQENHYDDVLNNIKDLKDYNGHDNHEFSIQIFEEYYFRNFKKYFNRNVENFSYNKLCSVDLIADTTKMHLFLENLVISERNFNHILLSLELMEAFNGDSQLKTKIFILPLYNQLLNDVYTHLLKNYLIIEGIKENKNLMQKTLTPIVECLSKREYDLILSHTDNNIRNSLSHGNYIIDNNGITFKYRKGQEVHQLEIEIYTMEDSLYSLLDCISGVFFSIYHFLLVNRKNLNIDSLPEEIQLHFKKHILSTFNNKCIDYFTISIGNESKQLNVGCNSSIDLDESSRIFFSQEIAKMIVDFEQLNSKDNINISFTSPKTIKSFIRYRVEDIVKLSLGEISNEELIQITTKEQNLMLWPVNDENRNLIEDTFRVYPPIIKEEYTISDIKDISIEDAKRLKGQVFLSRVNRRSHVKRIINSIIQDLLKIKNYGFSNNKVKHGSMPADIIYLQLYRNEVRHGKERALYPSNRNFIAVIQYDLSKQFPIKNQFFRHLSHSKEGNIEYFWNPNF
ncbi:hypothetical protein [Paenibacillus sp. GM2]|uniref:hypothetical protein n=1 Tax=Paenibacillus sp. GM2 TaxID=1622070 RepID=UPI001E5D3E67|nr:hypothetical protein [Paenibacillus sp. GM2]